jgi:hypothetical protein
MVVQARIRRTAAAAAKVGDGAAVTNSRINNTS